MAVTEEARFEVHTYFEEAMGRERAGTLMELLPPVGWGDVATERDVERSTQELKLEMGQLREWASVRFDAIEERFGFITESMATKADLYELHGEIRKDLLTTVFALLAAMVAVFGLLIFRGG